MKLHLVRHAQSSWQVAQSDDLDTCLTSIGHEQARLLGRWLAGHSEVSAGETLDVAAICSSPFQRSLQTAAYPADALGIPILVQRTLGEADFHVADHLPAADGPLLDHGPFEPSDAYAAFKAQSQDALAELVGRAQDCGGPVLAVTHGGLIKTLLRHVGRTEALCFRLCNSGVTTIEWRGGRWHLVHLNLWDHLPARLRTW